MGNVRNQNWKIAFFGKISHQITIPDDLLNFGVLHLCNEDWTHTQKLAKASKKGFDSCHEGNRK
jgi:hypothetical protein